MSRTFGIKLVAAIWVALVAAYVVWRMVAGSVGQQENPRSLERLSRIAAELNRGLPVMIDKETEMLPAKAAQAMLIYSYRLVSFSADKIDYEKFAAAAKQQVVQGACGRAETRDEFLKQSVTLRYSYYDKDKKHIATVDVLPADCGL